MDISQAFPGDYLKADDIGEPRNLLMETVVMETLTNPRTTEEEDKPVLHFMDCDQSLVLNKTNARTIAQMYGQNTEHWKGKKITLIRAQTEMQGKPTPCIRIQIDEVPF